MRIAVGADHAGTPVNEVAIAELRRLGNEGAKYLAADDVVRFLESASNCAQFCARPSTKWY